MRGATPHIIVTGPESSGKTTLSRAVAAHFNGTWVPEYARHYLEKRHGRYEKKDLLRIARGQYLWERYMAQQGPAPLVSDTSMLVLKVWSDYRFGQTHSWILERLRHSPQPLYLLCAPDIPWTEDPLRENPHDRELLFDIYRKELEGLGAPYAVIRGKDREERLRQGIKEVVKVGSEGDIFD